MSPTAQVTAHVVTVQCLDQGLVLPQTSANGTQRKTMTESAPYSDVLLDLLRKFDERPMSQSDLKMFFDNQGWEEALGMPVSEAFAFLKDKDLVREARSSTDLVFLANALLSVSELKNLLKKESLKLAGKKADLVNRIADSNPCLLAESISSQVYFVATDRGRALVAERVRERRSRRERCELAILLLLKDAQVVEAIHTWNQYAEAERFSTTIEGGRVSREIGILRGISEGSCAYLESRLPLKAIDCLRLYAAMMHLCGKSLSQAALDQLRPDIERFKQLGGDIAPDLAARMLTFYAIGQESLRSFKEMGYALLRTSACGDSCDFCQSQSAVTYSIELAPELPHRFCTHDSGCRCTYLMCSD